MEKYDSRSKTASKTKEQSIHEPAVHYCRAQWSGTDHDSSIEDWEKSHSHPSKYLKLVCPASDQYWEELDFRNYCLADKCHFHNDEVIWGADWLAENLQVQIILRVSHSFEAISILSFLSVFLLREIWMVYKRGRPLVVIFFWSTPFWRRLLQASGSSLCGMNVKMRVQYLFTLNLSATF